MALYLLFQYITYHNGFTGVSKENKQTFPLLQCILLLCFDLVEVNCGVFEVINLGHFLAWKGVLPDSELLETLQ